VPNDKPTQQPTIGISRELFEAVKLSGDRGYAIALRAGTDPSTLSKLLHGAVRIRLGDPRVIAVAKAVGVPPERAFARYPSADDIR
jgi:hypothetical protein